MMAATVRPSKQPELTARGSAGAAKTLTQERLLELADTEEQPHPPKELRWLPIAEVLFVEQLSQSALLRDRCPLDDGRLQFVVGVGRWAGNN